MEPARLIIDAPKDGASNMAIDQAILSSADRTGVATLRFYSWDRATLSLGYFQNHESRALHPDSTDCPLIRRVSGGGAIVHDRELTYSLCLPAGNRLSTDNTGLYRTMHQLIIDSLKEQGVSIAFYDRTSKTSFDPDAFLCFERRTDGDLVLDGHKVCGSAQRRLRKSLIQHGSILLQQSAFAPQLPGMEELTGLPIDSGKLRSSITDRIAASLRMNFAPGELTAQEQTRLEASKEQEFKNESWNRKR